MLSFHREKLNQGFGFIGRISRIGIADFAFSLKIDRFNVFLRNLGSHNLGSSLSPVNKKRT